MTDVAQITTDILVEMYEEAQPPLDFKHLLENPEEAEEDWYMKHYLSQERQDEIIEKHAEKHDLTRNEHAALIMDVTGYAPTSSTGVEP